MSTRQRTSLLSPSILLDCARRRYSPEPAQECPADVAVADRCRGPIVANAMGNHVTDLGPFLARSCTFNR